MHSLNLLPWDLPAPFIRTVQVESAHIDALNHVNNVAYVSWCQDAGWGHTQALGLGMDSYRELDRAMVIRSGSYDYVQAAVLGDTLQIGTWLTASDGRLSLQRHFQIIRLADRATVLRGVWQLVCIELSSGKPRRMPPLFLQRYGAAVVAAPAVAAMAGTSAGPNPPGGEQ